MSGPDEGGDPACWLARVCPACGRLADDDPPTRCPGCGADLPADVPAALPADRPADRPTDLPAG